MKYDFSKMDFSGWPLPDEYLIEVGRISSLWSMLETFLNLCLGKLSGFSNDDPRFLTLVLHASFPQKLDALGSLCDLLKDDNPHLSPYKEVISKIKTAQTGRNRFLHNTFSFDPDSRTMRMPVGSSRGTLKVSSEEITMDDLKRVSVDISIAVRALYKLVLKRDLPDPWKIIGT